MKIADYGDVYINSTNPSKNQDEITNTVCKIAKETFPMVCGGDHSITYGSFRGFCKAMKEKFPNYEVGIIHFDAHLDVEKGYLIMPEVWHDNVFRKLIEDGYLKGENLYTLGPRGVVDKEWFNYEKEQKINLYSANDIKRQGIVNLINKICESNKNKNIIFYVSFDIDAIDVSYIFGTGTPQCNGLTHMNVIML